jgi:DNA-directed RNA polymerase subunit beta'
VLTTLGTLRINDALPEDLRKPEHTLDKKGMHALMQQVAEQHPDDYKDTLQKLNNVGRDTVYNTGTSLSLSALRKSPAKEAVIGDARKEVDRIVNDDSISDPDKDKQIIAALLPLGPKLTDALYDEAKRENNPYFTQLISGSRGKKSDYNSLRGADLLTSDHTGKILPVPMLHSYAEGLDPAEYWASTYAQRKGAIGVKFAVGDAGFINKQLVNAAHRLVVDKEQPAPTRLPVGLPVPTEDKDNVGGVLAKAAGDYPAGTTLTKAMLDQLKAAGEDEIVLHSPMTESSPDGGISRLAAGRRDRFGLSQIGDNIGIPAAQAIGEKLSQGSLGSKHSAAMAKVRGGREGFEYLNRLIQAPEEFPEAGPLSDIDGYVKSIRKAPQGGHYVTVEDKEHYAPAGVTPIVAEGQKVDAGDDLTDGVPHPTELLRHRGIGEARRVYMNLLKEALDNSGIDAHRRNLEPIAGSLMNWAKVTDPDGLGEHLPDDVVGYNQLTHGYAPRGDATLQPVKHSIGRHLEEGALHYGVGTRITRKVADHLEKHGIADVYSHEHPPGFEPHMQRGVMGVHEDPDALSQQAGFYTSSAFQTAVSRGKETDDNSSSFVGALARGKGFGSELTRTGHYGAPPDVKGLPGG